MKRLASRMLALAAAQVALLALAAVIIWHFTRPHHGPRHRPPPPRPGVEMPQRTPPAPIGPLLTLGIGALVLSAGAIFTARWLVRPIEALSATADALGRGELSARSGLARTDELGQLGRRIDDMGARIEQMRRGERELLANVAHELRTPLSRIGVALDLAREGDGDRARSSLGEIAIDVAELEVIVDDLLTALRYDIDGGAALPLRRERTTAAALVEAAESRMRARHPERALEVHVDDGLPELDVDPVLFRRVLDNLLDNAHKYTFDPAPAIALTARHAGDTVELEVADRGAGIAEADLPYVFAPFFRADRSRSRGTGGVGLGLTLAQRIVEAHGATIAVASRLGEGTHVTIRVPAAS